MELRLEMLIARICLGILQLLGVFVTSIAMVKLGEVALTSPTLDLSGEDVKSVVGVLALSEVLIVAAICLLPRAFMSHRPYSLGDEYDHDDSTPEESYPTDANYVEFDADPDEPYVRRN